MPAHPADDSAGKAIPAITGTGSPWIAGTLGEAVLGAARTKTFLGSRYHLLARKRGKQRAIVATGTSILVIAPGSADAPPGAAACPVTDRFSVQAATRAVISRSSCRSAVSKSRCNPA